MNTAACIVVNRNVEYLRMACVAVSSLLKSGWNHPIYLTTCDQGGRFLWNSTEDVQILWDILEKLGVRKIVTNKVIKHWNYEILFRSYEVDRLVAIDCDMYFNNCLPKTDEIFSCLDQNDSLIGVQEASSAGGWGAKECYLARQHGFLNGKEDIARLFNVRSEDFEAFLQSKIWFWGNIYFIPKRTIETDFWNIASRYGYAHWDDEGSFYFAEFFTGKNAVYRIPEQLLKMKHESLNLLRIPQITHYAGPQNKAGSQAEFTELFNAVREEVGLSTRVSSKIYISGTTPSVSCHDSIFVFGMKRSGNHACASWVLGHYNEPYLYFQNHTPKTTLGHQPFVGRRTDEEQLACVVGFEDTDLKNIDFTHLIFDQIKNKRHFNILILRDPFNQFASSLFSWQMRSYILENSSLLRETWKEYAREYLGLTNYLPNKIVFNFNKWFSDQDYRLSISKQFGFGLSDCGLQRMWIDSSFDKMNFKQNAQAMKVLDRYSMCSTEILNYIQKLLDEEVWDLSEKIFGTDFVNRVQKTLSRKCL